MVWYLQALASGKSHGADLTMRKYKIFPTTRLDEAHISFTRFERIPHLIS